MSRAADDPSQADVGIVCALPLECAPLLERLQRVRHYDGGEYRFHGGRYDQRRLVIVESGAGSSRAQRAARALIEAHRPDWIISYGFAGALIPELRIGDVILGQYIRHPHAPPLHIEMRFSQPHGSGWRAGDVLTLDHLVRTLDEKRLLAQNHPAICIDMESYGVVTVCRDFQCRCLVIRAISDDMSQDLPPEIYSLLGATGPRRWGALLASLWNRPGCYKDLWRMRESALEAAQKLADFLLACLPLLMHSAPPEPSGSTF